MYKTFPREVRDAIYAYLFDAVTTRAVSLCAQPSVDQYPIHTATLHPSSWPRFIKPGTTHRAVVLEIIQAFYDAYRAFEVTHPVEIRNLLNQDFFRMGVIPANGMLSAFKVSGCIEPGYCDSVVAERLEEHFAPLLACARKRDFELTIELRSRALPWYLYRENIPWLAEILATTMQALRPVVKAVRAESREAKVFVKLLFGGSTIVVRPEHLRYTKEEWTRRMKVVLECPAIVEEMWGDRGQDDD